jgi:hypothetical protein
MTLQYELLLVASRFETALLFSLEPRGEEAPPKPITPQMSASISRSVWHDPGLTGTA